jgi:sec-independent protein translocase protein TatC
MFEEVKPHLVELRKRIFISVVALVVSFILSFIFYKPILDWVTAPLFDALEGVQKSVKRVNEGVWKVDINSTTAKVTKSELNSSTKEQNVTIKKVSLVEKAINGADRVLKDKNSTATEIALATSLKDLATYVQMLKSMENNSSVAWGSVTTRQIGGVFMVALKVSLYASIFLALPIILWQAWLFIAPGLYDNEKKLALPFLFGVTIMFVVGVLFAYYVVAPFGFEFLITFGAFLYTPLINIEDYIGFFAKILFGFGLAFELPMVIYFLALIGLVTEKSLIAFFKYAIVIIFIVAAILTPPDVITQLLMATPLIILYGISIIIAKIVNPADREDDEDENKEQKEDRKLLKDGK